MTFNVKQTPPNPVFVNKLRLWAAFRIVVSMPFHKLFLLGIIVPLVLAASGVAHAAGEATISGFVSDSSNGERLIGATVSVKGTRIGCYTNKKGYYVLQGVSPGNIILRISYLGFRPLEVPLNIAADESRTLDFILAPQSLKENSITVEARRDVEREEVKISSITVTPQQVKQMPAVGESDLFRALQFLPGVLALSDFSSGLYIRGGSPDQNLILLDGTVVYNPSHLFGFFSAFDPDAIKNVELLKGGFPAEYGGRLSAVLSVENKDGNRKEYEGAASIGLISSHASWQGPLPFGSFFISARRTYVDFLVNLTNASANFNNGDPLPSYYFYDLNAKVNIDLPGNDRLMLSTYFGSDVLTFGSSDAFSFSFDWSNIVASAHYTHVFNDKLFGTFLVSGSQFKNILSGQGEGEGYTFDNEIRDYTAKGDISWYASKTHLVKFGASATAYNFILKNTIGTDSARTNIALSPTMYGAYAQDDWKFLEGWTLQTGFRTDVMSSAPKQTVDPRIALRYAITPDVTAKLAWGIYHQYLHLATPERQQFFDIWLPTDNTLQASAATQYVAGVETHPVEGFDFNVDLYYKNLTNLTEYKSNTAGGFNVANAFEIGAGRDYGAEFFLQKNVGAVTGWVGYTLAWAWETFGNLNLGQEFPPKYDRRHDINVVVAWKLSDIWRFGAAFTYGTGEAYTDITARYEVDPPGYGGNTFRYPGPRDGLRLAPYHRMDVSATHSFHLFGWPADFSLQIFNVYNHRNEWTINYDTRQNPATKQIVYLLPILPTISLSVTF